jgi:hypothetical protein
MECLSACLRSAYGAGLAWLGAVRDGWTRRSHQPCRTLMIGPSSRKARPFSLSLIAGRPAREGRTASAHITGGPLRERPPTPAPGYRSL